MGKTFLINVISKWADMILREKGTDPLDPIVLLITPTGKSASLIGGSTMHSALDCRFETRSQCSPGVSNLDQKVQS